MKLTIDNKVVEVLPGTTVLTAAKAHDIYIPAICHHPELTPYGGCRLCMVEIEGQRGYPTACTTKVEENMVVRTQSKTLQEMRRDMMQLILSEHPASCLICDEKKDCGEYMTTIRKVGMTTGCRWCPKDKDCELQKVVEYLEIDEITFPVYYRALEPETEDPFYDRDYNLCIYCGRCVRICDEYRRSSVITLNQRGRFTTIGPAFGTSHIEGECEFCGACISVCPTGALSEKKRKWDGVPEALHPSICAFCGLHCEVQHVICRSRIIGVIPSGDPHTSGGELCVKGRFVLSDLLNHQDRLLEPIFRFEEGEGIVNAEEAIQSAVAALAPLQDSSAFVFISPDLCQEDMQAAVDFSQAAFKEAFITSSVLTKGFIAFAALAQQSVPVQAIAEADCLVSFFLNGNYGYSPTTLAIKKAASDGVPYYQAGNQHDTTSRFATEQSILDPGKAESFLQQLISALDKPVGNARIDDLAAALKASSRPLFIIGMDLAESSAAEYLPVLILKLMEKTKAQYHLPLPYANLPGLLRIPNLRSKEEANDMIAEGKIGALLTLGDTPYLKTPSVPFILSLASFRPPQEFLWNLLLPVSMWGEHCGILINSDGSELTCQNGIPAPENVTTVAEIFQRLSAELKLSPKPVKFAQATPPVKQPEVRKHQASAASDFAGIEPPGECSFWLVQSYHHFTHQDIDLAQVIDGMTDLLPSGTLIMHPDDALNLELKSGDSVLIDDGNSHIAMKLLTRHLPHKGSCLLNTHPDCSPFNANPVAVSIRRKDV